MTMQRQGLTVIALILLGFGSLLALTLLVLHTELLTPSVKVNDSDVRSKQFGSGLSLLITQHGEPRHHNNIVVYRRHSLFPSSTTNEKLVRWSVSGYALEGKSVEGLRLQNLRGMLAYKDRLFFTAAHTSSSKILDALACSESQREAHVFTVDHLSHPYALAARGEELYVTNQNTDTVVRFELKGLLEDATKVTSSEPRGTVIASVSGPRGLAFAGESLLFVASTNRGLLWFDLPPMGTPQPVGTLQRSGSYDEDLLPHPVGVLFDKVTELLFVGSVWNEHKNKKKRENGGGVHVMDPKTKQVVRVLRPNLPHHLHHPAGIAIADRTLFVVGQSAGVVFAWDLRDWSYIGVAIDTLPPKPEQIIALRCPQS